MRGLLTDEAAHVLLDPPIGDERQRLTIDVAEPVFASRQQQVEHVHDVRREGIAGHPRKRRLAPIEADAAWANALAIETAHAILAFSITPRAAQSRTCGRSSSSQNASLSVTTSSSSNFAP